MSIGGTELFVIVLVALLVFGPIELPRVMRTAGGFVQTVRRLSGDFRRQFDEAVREAERDASDEAARGNATRKQGHAGSQTPQQPPGEGSGAGRPEEANATYATRAD